MEQIWVGVDVGKANLDVWIPAVGKSLRIGNDSGGHKILCERLRELESVSVVVEATGGYEKSVHQALASAEVSVSVVNPREVRDFAKSMGKLAKIDQLDAKVLSRFGEVRKPRQTPCPTKVEVRIRALDHRRVQLVHMIRQEKCALENVDAEIESDIRANIESLEARLKAIAVQLDSCIASNAELKRRRELLQEQKGVGPVVSGVLIAHMPELGTLNRKQIAALAGLASYNRDSGQMQGKRTCWGGRARIYRACPSPIRVDSLRRGTPIAR
jgi:transposase